MSQVAALVGAALIAAAVVVAVMPGVSQAAPNVVAEGRKHAERAGHLAAKGKCGQAIGEYDKAIAVLHDPTLLFNRGECHRRLGDVESALEDYNQFLSDLPDAPNRAQVEARIAELRNQKPGGETAAASTTPSAPAVSGAAGPAPRTEPRRPTVEVSPPPPVATAPRLDVASPPPSQATAPDVLAPPVEPGPTNAASSSASGADSLSHRPWFWVALGAVVVGAGLGAYFVLGRDPTNVPRSDLGNYRF